MLGFSNQRIEGYRKEQQENSSMQTTQNLLQNFIFELASLEITTSEPINTSFLCEKCDDEVWFFMTVLFTLFCRVVIFLILTVVL